MLALSALMGCGSVRGDAMAWIEDGAMIGEIRVVAGRDIPEGWFPCDGRELKIADYSALYSVIGFKFGGSGPSFRLPDMRGRTIVGATNFRQGPDNNHTCGAAFGAETVTLTDAHLPRHQHAVRATRASDNQALGKGAYFARAAKFGSNPVVNIYAAPGDALVSLRSSTVSVAGDRASHDNMQPFAVVQFCIVHKGLYPSMS